MRRDADVSDALELADGGEGGGKALRKAPGSTVEQGVEELNHPRIKINQSILQQSSNGWGSSLQGLFFDENYPLSSRK